MDYSERTKFNFEDDLLGEQAVNKFLVDFLYERFKEKGYIIDFEVSRELNKQHAYVGYGYRLGPIKAT